MCGISGVVSLKDKNVNLNIVKEMSKKISHRGPDDFDLTSCQNLHIGFNRLSIVGIQNGNQPFYSNDKDIIAWVNGEIYNYKEIKDTICKDYKFKTNSDCEVVISLYKKFGSDFIKYIRGMFIILIFDKKKQEINIYRDRLGEKPLYYAVIENDFIFSSEIKSFSIFKKNFNDINYEAIYEYLLNAYFIDPKTPFKNLKKIASGSHLKLNTKNLNFAIKSYWSVDDIKPIESKNPTSLIKDQLIESILLTAKCNDNPVGVALSGGIDSSLICNVLKQNKVNFQSFTLGYEEYTKNDEIQNANSFASQIGIKNENIKIKKNEILNNFKKLCYDTDEPIADIASFSYLSISKRLKERKYKVLLQGHGLDELFWGYDWVKRSALQKKTIKDKLSLLIYGNSLDELSYFNKLNKDFLYSCYKVNDYLSENFLSFKKKDFIDSFYNAQKNEKESVKITKLILNSYLKSNGINQSEKIGMSQSVELRLPFVDYKLIETIIGLRLGNSLNDDHILNSKYFLNESIKDLIPKNIFQRKKRGFTPPSKKWYKLIFDNYKNLLKDGFLIKFNILDNKKLDSLIKNNNLMEKYYLNTPILFKFIILEMWFVNFFDTN